MPPGALTFIVSLLFPGISLINWGEKQAFYILENTNANYGKASKSTPESRALTHIYSLWQKPNVFQ
jgi:hypothetical protein